MEQTKQNEQPTKTAEELEAENKKAAEEAAKKKAEEGQELVYTVKSGDTLAGIAAEYNVNMNKIAEANGLKEPYSLEIGQQLKIPGVKAPTATDTTKPADGTTTTTTGTEKTYTVKAGDTLAQIGAEVGVPYQDIMKLNNITDASKIEIGQVLKIPTKQ